MQTNVFGSAFSTHNAWKRFQHRHLGLSSRLAKPGLAACLEFVVVALAGAGIELDPKFVKAYHRKAQAMLSPSMSSGIQTWAGERMRSFSGFD